MNQYTPEQNKAYRDLMKANREYAKEIESYAVTWVVVKSRTRHYGYALKDTTGKLTCVIGPDHTCGWYKYKYVAQQRADELNKCEAARHE